MTTASAWWSTRSRTAAVMVTSPLKMSVFEGFVGGDDGGAALIAVAEDLKEQVGAEFVDGQVPELIDQEDFGACVAFEASLEPIRRLGRRQGIDDVHRRGEELSLIHI